MTTPEKVVKNILGKPRDKKTDRDLDGVSNSKDCQPDNPMRQDPVRIAGEGLSRITKNLSRNHMSGR